MAYSVIIGKLKPLTRNAHSIRPIIKPCPSEDLEENYDDYPELCSVDDLHDDFDFTLRSVDSEVYNILSEHKHNYYRYGKRYR